MANRPREDSAAQRSAAAGEPSVDALVQRAGLQAYVVGGTVRDRLLGRAVNDRDWVVVGATPQQMLDAGFRLVGRDFPVFLHPQTQEEFALARSERKSAPGYRGFIVHADPSVTLEQDLARRDLTINAMALRPDGTLIDPFGGQRDLRLRVLRHVSAAFAEDPVRILRVARFAARFADFTVAPQTLALMRAMVDAGEAQALVAERVWQELARGLMEPRPSRMFELLRDCGALQVLLPEVHRLWGVPQPAQHHPEIDTGVHLMMVLDQAARLQAPLPVRFACLCHDLGKGDTPADQWPRHLGHEQRSVRRVRALCQRWKVPAECRELAELAAREHGHVHASLGLEAAAMLRLLGRCDALRRPQRFADLLLACECDARGRLGFDDAPYPQRDRLLQALAFVRAVDTQAVAQPLLDAGRSGQAIGRAVDAARLEALRTGFAGAGAGTGASCGA
jgi:tRNA nucleotidyltransferase (CCA-adding enzyme)